MILRNRLEFPPELGISEEAQNLISALLHPVVTDRLSMSGVLDHPWFTETDNPLLPSGEDAEEKGNEKEEDARGGVIAAARKKMVARRHNYGGHSAEVRDS